VPMTALSHALGRRGARVASRQRPILRHGAFSVLPTRVGGNGCPGSLAWKSRRGCGSLDTCAAGGSIGVRSRVVAAP